MTESSTTNKTPDEARNVPQVNRDQDGPELPGSASDPYQDRQGRERGT
jgi:hypothetical protein